SLSAGAGKKMLLVLAVLAITGFLAGRSPIAVVLLPTFAWRLPSDVPSHWSLDWHYSAVLMPVVCLALVDALRTAPLRRSARWVADGWVCGGGGAAEQPVPVIGAGSAAHLYTGCGRRRSARCVGGGSRGCHGRHGHHLDGLSGP